jgi:hypothetical protein
MQDQAAKDTAHADAARAKAALLRTTKPEEADANIAAAMAAVGAAQTKPTGSVSDRLAALRARQVG